MPQITSHVKVYLYFLYFRITLRSRNAYKYCEQLLRYTSIEIMMDAYLNVLPDWAINARMPDAHASL